MRACLNFPIKYFYPPLLEFVSGLFPRFYSSDSPLSSSQKQKNILENNSQTEAEQNLNRLFVSKLYFLYFPLLTVSLLNTIEKSGSMPFK